MLNHFLVAASRMRMIIILMLYTKHIIWGLEKKSTSEHNKRLCETEVSSYLDTNMNRLVIKENHKIIRNISDENILFCLLLRLDF